MIARLSGAGAVLALWAMLHPTAAAAQAAWAEMPRMELEGQYAGPLRDTIIQRYRDPFDGTLCFIYLPITAQHSSPNANGLVTYGPNTIGSISCVHAGLPAQDEETAPPQPGDGG